MIAKISKGNGFAGTLRYVFRERESDITKQEVEQVAGTVWLSEGRLRTLIKEFESTLDTKQNIASPVWHCSLSIRQEEGRLSIEKWGDIANEFMKKMRFPVGSTWVAVHHLDRPHDHVHIVASRVAFSKVWDDYRDHIRANEATSELEKEFTLMVTDRTRKRAAKTTSADYFALLKEQRMTARIKVQSLIDLSLKDPIEIVDFKNFLLSHGVHVKENRAQSTDRISGLSFSLGSFTFKGSQLGKAYSFSSLCKRGLSLSPIRSKEQPRTTPSHSVSTISNTPKKSRTQLIKDRAIRAANATKLNSIPVSKVCLFCLTPTNCDECKYRKFKKDTMGVSR